MAANLNVALVHDSLQDYGDAERVLEVLHRLYPNAPVYTAFVDRQALGTAAVRFVGWDLRTTSAQNIPGITRYWHALRGLLPYFWEALDLSAFDLVISLSGNYLSQAVLTGVGTLHVSYCHTPPRYLWDGMEWDAPQAGIASWYAAWVNSRLRQYDFYTAQRVDSFVANSQGVARRIRKVYRRSADVIPPPVKIQGTGEAGDQYYLYVGRLARHLQVDLAIEACNRLDLPLWIVGTGDDTERLQMLAGDRVRFLGEVPESALIDLYANAKAFIFPSTREDFGFAPVEAMGCGVPVIASQLSGMREVVLDYRTGLLFPQPTVESLVESIAQFESLRFSSQACIERAQEFAESVFLTKFEWFIAQRLDEHRLSIAGTKPDV